MSEGIISEDHIISEAFSRSRTICVPYLVLVRNGPWFKLLFFTLFNEQFLS